MKKVTLVLLAALMVTPGMVAAHSKAYINPNPSVGVSISETECDTDPLMPLITSISNIGGACFFADDAVPDADGEQHITVLDNNVNPSTATYCQDLDGDFICGERCLSCDPALGLREEPAFYFCGVADILVASAADLFPKTRPQWHDSPNWFTDAGFVIFTMGIGQANAATGETACAELVSPGTQGVIFHAE